MDAQIRGKNLPVHPGATRPWPTLQAVGLQATQEDPKQHALEEGGGRQNEIRRGARSSGQGRAGQAASQPEE